MLQRRCPHCQEELPGPDSRRGRFCASCGSRIEGWGGLVARVPSSEDRTRPVVVPAHLIKATAPSSVDEEEVRITLEMPAPGHDLRSVSPDHRVHTSPTGTALPNGLAGVLSRALKASGGASSRRPPPEAVPVAVQYEHTDVVRRLPVDRTPPALRLLLLACACGAVATVVAALAYRLILHATGRWPEPGPVAVEIPPPPPAPVATRLKVKAGPATMPGARRTRDLVVSVPAPRPAGPPKAAAAPPDAAVVPAPPSETKTEGEGERAVAEALSDPVAEAIAADIEFVAAKNHAQVRACHDRAFKSRVEGSPGGRVELAFTLTSEGRATGVSTVSNDTGSEALARCLEQRVAEWRFPRAPAGAGGGVFQFPFVFLATPAAIPARAGIPAMRSAGDEP